MRRPSVNTRDRDEERARQVALDGLILRGLVGSTVHGLSNPGTDDRDEMGVCIEPPELSAQHGYDTKYAMHALRIAVQGIELLSTGRISLPVCEPDRGRLRAVRAGRVPLDEVVAQLDELTARLQRLSADSELPDAGDAERVDRFLVEAYLEAWG